MKTTRLDPVPGNTVPAWGARLSGGFAGAAPGESLRVWRAARRACGLLAVIGLGLAAYAGLVAKHRGRPTRTVRAGWLQGMCRAGLRVLGVRLAIEGAVPERGLVVGNHLSYLDILVLGALSPSVFVSKSEVRRWPVFGWCAVLAGTIFLRRARRGDVARVLDEMRRDLADGALVVLFPEGTTTDGRVVLPFKPALLEPAAGPGHPVTPFRLDYALTDGVVAEEVCYWGDMTLVPHLWNLLGKDGVEARVRFGRADTGAGVERRELARRLQATVIGLSTGSV